MKRPKKNPDLAQALADLRDWAWLEAKAEQTGTGQRQWLDVRDWAEGTALKYRVELPKPRPSIERRCSRTTPTRRPCPASSESPWKPIGELGEIAYMEDGSRRWTLKAGWEDMRLFLVYLSSGEVERHFAYIDGGGTLGSGSV